MMDLLHGLLELALEAAPWILLGLLLSALVRAWLPESWLRAQLGAGGRWTLLKASLLGAPLPLCSCGVLPLAGSLQQGGASRGAVVSFVVATPETGPDSLAVTWGLLGPVWAVLRPVAAVMVSLACGLGVGREAVTVSGAVPSPAPAGSAVPSADWRQRLAGGMGYAFGDLWDDIWHWLLLGLALAAAVAMWVPPETMAELGSGVWAMLAVLLLGIPLYVCATAATPMAVGMLLAGMSPGVVLVFLLTAPATNLALLVWLRRVYGAAVLWRYLLSLSLTAIALGLLVDAVWAAGELQPVALAAPEAEPGTLAVLSLAVLGLLTLVRLLKKAFPNDDAGCGCDGGGCSVR